MFIFLYYFHIATVIVFTNIIFIIIIIFAFITTIIVFLSISNTKYFNCLLCLGTTMKINAFLPVLCYPCIFVFSPYIHQENGAHFLYQVQLLQFIHSFIFFTLFFNQELIILELFFCSLTFVYFSTNGKINLLTLLK